MNKTKKRQLNIKNKLIAAIAMLLVSSIMMVSTTYAWFTLSTAPEVQGITTTVGANGNLEIALSPENGDYNLITTGTTDAIKDWVDRNKTWGNLLDLSDSGYRLEELTLLPSRLNIAPGANGASATLGLNPLKVPVYGADGRISALKADGVGLGGYQTLNDAAGFMAGNSIYGVRAVGTSSTMSPDQIAFNSALSAMDSNTTVASTIVGNALTEYGSALATMAVKRALNYGTDDYRTFVPALKALSAELQEASDSVETALYYGLMALAKTEAGADKKVGEQSAYAYIKEQMDGDIALQDVWSAVEEGGFNLNNVQQAAPFVNAYTKWATTDAAVEDNATKVNALNADAAVTWAEVSVAMRGLMNTDKVTVNGLSLNEVKQNLEALIGAGGVMIELNAGSGVLANFGELSGNIVANVRMSGDMEYAGIPLNVVPVTIATTTQPAAGPLLKQARALIAAIGAVQGGEDTANIIDVIYGYAIDFVFRTNAANSSLLLQTEGTDRIYDGTSGATMGNGSTITFSDKFNNLESLVSMMSGIRVVFTNTKGNEVYGIAKVNFDETPLKLNVTNVTRAVEPTGEGDTYEEKFTETTTEAKTWKLSVVSGAGTGKMVLTSGDLSDHQYIVWEIVKDEATGETYAKATVKTALYATVPVTVTTTPADGVAGESVNDTRVVEVKNANGELIFFEEYETVKPNTSAKETEASEAQVARLLAANNVTKLTYNETYTDPNGATVVVAGELELNADEQNAIADNYGGPEYLYIKNQDITLEGPLSLYNYTLQGDMLVFGEPMDVQTLTTLSQNVATGITAMVYLDGDYVDNGDVSNSVDGISNSGKLNLQFASSANLVPMTNTTLQNSIGVKFLGAEGLTFTGEALVTRGDVYKASIRSFSDKTYEIWVRGMEGDNEEGQKLGEIAPGGTAEVTVSDTLTKENIEIFVKEKAVTP